MYNNPQLITNGDLCHTNKTDIVFPLKTVANNLIPIDKLFSSTKTSEQTYTLQLPQLPFCNISKVVTVIRVPLCCE